MVKFVITQNQFITMPIPNKHNTESFNRDLKLENDPYFIKFKQSYFQSEKIHGDWIYNTYIEYLEINNLKITSKSFEQYLTEWYNTKFYFKGEFHLYRSFIALNHNTYNSPPHEKLDFEVYKNEIESLTDSEYIKYDSARNFQEIDEFWDNKKKKDDASNLKYGIIIGICVIGFIAFYISAIDIGSTLLYLLLLIIGAIIFGIMTEKAQKK